VREGKEEYLENKKAVAEIIAYYDREAHKIIHRVLDVYRPGEDYQVEPFAVMSISSFLHEWHHFKCNLPPDMWIKTIKMYLELIEIDWNFLDSVYAYMQYHRQN